jgi:aspartyl-tRNA(Asn)/glutamyl-tRNA(Gln) amidotransferase subunit A
MITNNKSIQRVNTFFKKLKKYDKYKIFIHTNKDDALNNALNSDKRIKSLSKLDGKLIAVKSNIRIKSYPFTAGIKEFDNNISNYNDPLIELIKNSGGIIIGMTNMDEAAFGGDTSTSFYGTCINPINKNYSVGGSSGGSAAAISSGIVKYAIGTDTMGSVRIPGSYCGIVAFKPSSQLIDNTHIKMLSQTYDTIGLMGKKVINIKELFNIINVNKTYSSNKKQNDELNIIVPNQIFDDNIGDDVLNNFKVVVRTLRKNNINVEYKNINYWMPNHHRKSLLKIVEYEGSINFKALLENKKSKISENLRSNLIYGKKINKEKISNIMKDLNCLKYNMSKTLHNNNLIIMPTTPQTSFNRKFLAPCNQANFTSLANISDLPSIAIPIYKKNNLLPFSLQILSSNKNDSYLLKISSYLEKLLQ